jgi:DNA modification methylase
LEYLKQQPIQFDLILFDPPFWPYKQAYQQVREWTVHELTPIECPTPEQYAQWWTRLCELALNWLKPSGWFCYKADSWTAKLTFPITTHYFDYSNEVIWDKCRIGLGRRIRTQHEQIECYTSMAKAKKYWKYAMFNVKNETHQNLDHELVKVNVNNRKWHGDKNTDPAFASIIRLPNFNNGVLGVKETIHINQTPPELWYKFLDYMCPPNGNVLDLTMGSGSIELAVQYLNRHGASRECTGIEVGAKEYQQAVAFLQPQTVLSQCVKK